MPLTKSIASKVFSCSYTNFEFDDLIEHGMIGLLDAIEKYEPNRNLHFSTYATLRIRGTIIDAIRSFGSCSRNTIKDMHTIENTRELLHGRLGRCVSNAEIAEEIGISIKKVQQIYAASIRSHMVSIYQSYNKEPVRKIV